MFGCSVFGGCPSDSPTNLPNTLGFLFGIFQMVLYIMYKNAKPVVLEDPVKVQELSSDHVVDLSKLGGTEEANNNNAKDQRNFNSGEKV